MFEDSVGDRIAVWFKVRGGRSMEALDPHFQIRRDVGAEITVELNVRSQRMTGAL